MALINIAAALQRADELLHRLQPPAGLQIRTHKRNRGLIIRKLAQDRFLVRERGYLDKAAGRDELHCQLKSRAKREF
ncbi:MAG: hypothetical protein OEV91_00605, partial [Desulfobulbaceae bacterium]|nr:hypothetical protein [Desulfobulbaceae bacterium]